MTRPSPAIPLVSASATASGRLAAALRAAPVALLRGFVYIYRWVVSPLLGPSCRFQPTCSDYALEALSMHGAVRGSWLTLRRIVRCNPWGGSGWDPVPGSGSPGRGHDHAHINGGGCCGR